MTHQTLPRLIRARAAADPDRVYLQTVEGEEITYAEAHRRHLRWAAAYEALGVTAGETVCELLPATPVAIDSWMGIAWLGAIEVPINTAYRGNLLVHTIQDSGAQVICVAEQFLDQVREVADQLTGVTTVFVPDLADPALAADLPFRIVGGETLSLRDQPTALVEPAPTDLASILYTSGTTGPSKGVMVTWAQMEETSRTVMPWEEGEVFYSALPLYHVTAKVFGVYLPALSGGRAVLRETFKTQHFWSDVRTFGCTATAMVGSIPTFLSREPVQADDADNPLQHVLMVPLVADVEDMKSRFGFQVATVFNMTETSNPLTSDGFDLVDERSCGRPRPGYQVRLVDEHDREVAPGEAGELIVRTDEPWILNAGYWRRPEATVAAWRNLWFHTGDAFTCDAEGNYYFVDRMKDAIRRRGENISSFEVEREVGEHPDVLECAVVGVPSEFGEDEVKLFVVAKEGRRIEPAELHEFLRARLAKFMVPRFIAVVDELPKTPTLKVRKVELRAAPQGPDVWDALSTS